MAKNRLIGSLLLICILGCSSSSSSGGGGIVIIPPRWQNLFRTPTGENLKAVLFSDALNGIIVGDATSIFRTNDGGATWTQSEHLPFSRGGNLVSVSGSGTVLHAVGSDAAGGKFWVTPDSVNWLTNDVPGAGAPYTSVSVPTSSDALYLRSDGTVEQNSGVTPFPTENVGSGTWNVLQWFAGPGGLTSRAMAGGTDGGNAVIRERDSGVWSLVNMPVLPGEIKDLTMQSIFAGYACGGNFILRTFNTVDWVDADAGNTIPPGASLNAIHFFLPPVGVNITNGCVVGDNAAIYYSTDADAVSPTWTAGVINNLTVQGVNLCDVWFVDVNIGYAVGDWGVVLKTTDGGATWDDISNGGVQVNAVANFPDFNAVDFTRDGTIGLAIGNIFDDGFGGGGVANVWRTLDGGTTWELFNGGLPAEHLYGVSIPEVGGSGDLAYLCGANGLIRITRGLQAAAPGLWTPTTNGAPPNDPTVYRDIEFPGGDNFGIVVGDGGRVLDLNNSSLAIPPTFVWANPDVVPSSVPNYLTVSRTYTPSAFGGLRLYTAGSSNHVELMEPVGVPTPVTNWVQLAPLPPGGTVIQSMDSPPSVVDIAGVTLFAGATDGNVYVFSGGAWSTTTPTPTAAITAVVFPYGDPGLPANHSGLAINANGIFFTNDAGTTWSVSPDHTTQTLRGAWMSPLFPGLGAAVGDDGVILLTTVGGQ